MPHEYYVYIVTNRRGTLYTGLTGDLEARLTQHAQGHSRFTSRYRIWKLLFVESFADAYDAIACEKRVKGWTRAKKLALIRRRNPALRDLAWRWRRPRAGPGAYIGENVLTPVTLTKEEPVLKHHTAH
jgi:putative endonuclease